MRAAPRAGHSLRAAALWLAACSVAPAAQPLALWLDVPFVKQEGNGCGPASVAMVMGYWQARRSSGVLDTAQIVGSLQAEAAHGLRASDMARYFEQHGYRAIAYAGDWGELEHELQQGRPLIAALKPGAGHELHYVVVAGVDDREQVVLINDPAQRKLLKEERSRFEQQWRATGNWTLLAVPAGAR